MTNEEMMMYDYIVECGLATAEEINLAFNVACCGWTETINRIIYVRTGYNDFNQWLEAEMEEE